ncbi:hypothetical protein SDC9_202780 [bioreactor metagenome]|uniref:Uncharacterized protein n=1 Tax=bioreactor metagenome TaxID=1076179 RepID=A0A645IUL2_9ZZZZ
MRRRRGNAVVPGDDVPGDGPDQSAKHDMRVNDARLNNPLAHGCRHTEVEDENRHNVEERGKCHGLSRFENPRGNHGGNRIGSVVKAVHEIEQQGEHHQQNHNPEGCLYRLHDRTPARIRNSRGRCPRSGSPRLRSGP